MRLKKNDSVKVMTGEHKGATGRIIKVFPDKNTALVEGVNVVKRHTKPNPKNQQGGIVQKEAGINLSNLMLVDPKTGEPTRIGIKAQSDGKRVRFAKKSKELVD
ncbi:MAG: 50S ribosomal protein L24 [Chitinivibrionales bacterium]|nr:50S ribosomal protein L24 [Chitinivibrionales bacterium]